MNRRSLFSIVFLSLLSVYLFIFNVFVISNHSVVPGWSKKKSRQSSKYVLPNENTTNLQPSKLCHENDPIFLLIVSTSSPSNVEARQSIRESWGNFSAFNYPMFEKLQSIYSENFLSPSSKDWKQYVEVKVENRF